MTTGYAAGTGDIFKGYCKVHDTHVYGVLLGRSESVYVEGELACCVGDLAVGNCGCTSVIVSGSDSVYSGGRALAVEGSIVDGPIRGVVISGRRSIKINK